MIEKSRRRRTKAVLPSTWVELNKSCQPNRPFEVVFVKHPLTDDMRPDGTPIVSVFNFKHELEKVIQFKAIQKIRGVLFEKGECPKSRIIMSNDFHCRHVNLLKSNYDFHDLQLAFASAQLCVDFVSISKAKYDNIFSLLQAVALPDYATFYQTLCFTTEEDSDSN